MSFVRSFTALRGMRLRPRRASRLTASLGAVGVMVSVGAATGCSPYPDQGEFLAGVVFSNNFIAGTKTIDRLDAVGRGVGKGSIFPYTVIATSRGSDSSRAVSSSMAASSPFWSDNGKRKPLDVKSAQPVYVLDSSCRPPSPTYRFEPRFDLVDLSVQYPIFQDIPELLPANNGKAGRTASYSAVVEVIHLTAPGNLPCQSIKRFDTVAGRVGQDLVEGRHEYRLLQIIDPVAIADSNRAKPDLPVKLGFYNQLVVPYLDMGPVPVKADGLTFETMKLYKVSVPMQPLAVVVGGTASEVAATPGAPVYSPICQDYTLSAMALPPPDVTNAAYQMAKMTDALSSCLVCKTLDANGSLDCPFVSSQP